MPLIKNGGEIADDWTFVADNDALDSHGAATVSLTRWQEEADTLLGRNAPTGVRLAPDDDPHILMPWLDHILLIEVSFPKYTDGRGYSQAQLLRRRLGYRGELRAVGHVLRDQILYMHRSGIDAYQTDRADLHHVLEALAEYSDFYQPAADQRRSAFDRRHA